MIISEASSQSDIDTCIKIRLEVFVDEQGVDPSEEIDQFESISRHFLVTIDRIPAATARLRPDGKSLRFERIATLASFRGKGIGKALVTKMQDVAKKSFSHLTPTMHAQVHAIPFYEKLGWKVHGKPFDEAGIPHVIMELSG